MAGNIQNKYGTNNQSITVTLASLANNGVRASAVIDNTVNVFQDVLVFLQVKSASASVSSTGIVNIFAYGTANNGTTYTEGATGSDAGITLTSPPNCRLIGQVNVVANSTTYYGGPFSVAGAFRGVLPDHWGIFIQNNSGAALDGTESNHAKFYQGVYEQYT